MSGQFGVLYSSSTGWTVLFTNWCSTYSRALGRCGMDSDHCFYYNADCSGDCSGYCLLYMFPGRQ